MNQLLESKTRDFKSVLFNVSQSEVWLFCAGRLWFSFDGTAISGRRNSSAIQDKARKGSSDNRNEAQRKNSNVADKEGPRTGSIAKVKYRKSLLYKLCVTVSSEL